MTVSGIPAILLDLSRFPPAVIGRGIQGLNDVNHKTKNCGTAITYLAVAKDARASTTLSAQPHRWEISAKSKEGEVDFDDLDWPEKDFRHIPRIKDALYGVLWKSSSG